jgi:hypothetical protein
MKMPLGQYPFLERVALSDEPLASFLRVASLLHQFRFLEALLEPLEPSDVEQHQAQLERR